MGFTHKVLNLSHKLLIQKTFAWAGMPLRPHRPNSTEKPKQIKLHNITHLWSTHEKLLSKIHPGERRSVSV